MQIFYKIKKLRLKSQFKTNFQITVITVPADTFFRVLCPSNNVPQKHQIIVDFAGIMVHFVLTTFLI